MKIVFFILYLSFIIAPQKTSIPFQKAKTYLVKDLNKEIKPDDFFVILPIDMCSTCLIKHINTLNKSTKLVNVIVVGSSMKKIMYKTKELTNKHLNLIYDSKNIAIKKNICSTKELIIVSILHKSILKIPYNNFKSLANEIN